MTSDDGMDTGKAKKGGVSRRALLMTGAVTGAAAAGSMAVAGTAAAAPAGAAAGVRGTSPDGALRVNGHRAEYPQEIVDAMPRGLRLAFARSPSLIQPLP
jgi:hypothetical protein